MYTLRSSRNTALVAWSSLVLVAYIIAASGVHSHPAVAHRRHHTRHARRRSHVTHSDVIGLGSQRHHDDDVAVRETDQAAAEAIERLFGPGQFAPVAPPHPSDKPPGHAAARHGSHKHRHRHRHRPKTGGSVGESKTMQLELPVGCEAEPCQHDGDCYTDPSSPLGYACRCQPGYSGDFCEVGKWDSEYRGC